MITNLLLYLALFFHGTTVIRSNFPPPNRGVIGYCFDLKCIYDSLTTVQEIDPVVVSLISKSFVDDSYLALYLGSIVDLFDFSMVRPDLQVVFLILQAPSDLLFMDSAFRLMQLLPLKSILITIEHGAQSLSVKSLKVAYDLGKLESQLMYNLVDSWTSRYDNRHPTQGILPSEPRETMGSGGPHVSGQGLCFH
jgi:hypothetical protein